MRFRKLRGFFFWILAQFARQGLETYGPVWTNVKNIPDTEEHNVNTKHCIPYS